MDSLRKARKKNSRSKNGISILEMVVAIAILTGSLAVFSELATLLTIGSLTTTNKVEGLAAARTAMNRIAADVRQARAIGDCYADNSTARLQFPAATNPIYGTYYGAPPPIPSWPIYPWNMTMKLSSTILILQVPVTYENPGSPVDGMPLTLTIAQGAKPPIKMENLDTIVYEVVPDDSRPGQYLIQVARFPGQPIAGLTTSANRRINPPQTILKGLVGPSLRSSGSNIPSVFTFLPRFNSGPPVVTPTALDIDSIGGVGIDIEIKNTGLDGNQGDGRFPQIMGFHSEAFMRSNRNMTLNNN